MGRRTQTHSQPESSARTSPFSQVSPRRHGDSAESVLIPGSLLDGFESVTPQRSRRRGGLPNAPLEAVHPIQVAAACRNQCRGRQPVIDKAFEATGTSGFPIRSDDEPRHLLSARRTHITQPASVWPTCVESLSIHDGPAVFPTTDVSEREEAHRRPTRRVVLLLNPQEPRVRSRTSLILVARMKRVRDAERCR